MVYEWKQGVKYKADANAVGAELERLGDSVTAERVVEAARDARTELHRCFEWDDTVASEKYRLEQARRLLRKITVVHDVNDNLFSRSTQVKVRAFESVRLDEEKSGSRVYMPTLDALSNGELREQIFARLEQAITDAEKTAETYAYLCDDMQSVRAWLKNARMALDRAKKGAA
jgi:Mor family transcriptional regulator